MVAEWHGEMQMDHLLVIQLVVLNLLIVFNQPISVHMKMMKANMFQAIVVQVVEQVSFLIQLHADK